MAKVYLDYVKAIKEQDPPGGDNNDEIYYRVEGGSNHTVSNSFDAGETISYPGGKLLENDPATKADPLFFTLWEDDPGSSGDDKFKSISQFLGGDPGTIKDGGIYFDGTPGLYDFTFAGNGGEYDVGFSVR